MSRINSIYERNYSPQMLKSERKSANSKSQVLLGRSRVRNNNYEHEKLHNEQLPAIPSKYQRIIKEDVYKSKPVGTNNSSYIKAASFARLRNRSAQGNKVGDDASVASLYSTNKAAIDYR